MLVRSKNLGRVLEVKDARWDRASVNVVIGLKPNCPFCIASLPLYRRIVEMQRQSGSKVSVCALSENSPDAVREFLTKGGVDVG
jgi:hypothetical protein